MKKFLTLFLVLLFNFSYGKDSLKFAVLSYGNPVEEYKRYKILADYLSKEAAVDINIQIVKDINTLFDMFKSNQAQMAVGCSIVYFELKKKYNVEAVAVMKINGKAVENGVLITKSDSDIDKIEQVKGKKIVLGSPICMSNCVMPLYMLTLAGITQEDVHNIWSAGTDKGAIITLLSSLADVAGVREESLKGFEDRVKVIAKSPSFPRHILMVSKNINPKIYRDIERSLFILDSQTAEKMGIDGFVKPQSNMFEVIRKYQQILQLFPFVR
ncbi:MAG: phosphate/phosphite/phosphonate ABC transporter substrate-binding protein [Hydrogenothermaceae bacterium]